MSKQATISKRMPLIMGHVRFVVKSPDGRVKSVCEGPNGINQDTLFYKILVGLNTSTNATNITCIGMDFHESGGLWKTEDTGTFARVGAAPALGETSIKHEADYTAASTIVIDQVRLRGNGYAFDTGGAGYYALTNLQSNISLATNDTLTGQWTLSFS